MQIAVRVRRSSPWLIGLLGTVSTLLPLARAQEPPPGPEPTAAKTALRTIVLQNLSPHPRREVVSAVVPFARGAVSELPDLHVDGRATAWQSFGARWPDGSLRQGLCLFAAELPAMGQASLPLVPGAGPSPEGAFPELASTLVVKARTNLGEASLEPPVTATLEDNAMRKVELRSARLGTTGLVVELIVARGRGDAHAYVDAAVFFSDPATAAMQVAVEEFAIEATGMALLFRHPGRLCVQQQTTERGSRVVLLQQQVLGDGQGIRRCGSLLPALTGKDVRRDGSIQAAVLGPVRAATSWTGTGAFGAFGEPATMPDWLRGDGARAMLEQRHRAFAGSERPQPDPFVAYEFSGTKNAGQTGDQMDFGVTKLSVIATTGIGSFLLEVEPSVLQEACRPVHMFETDGAMLRALDHPKWTVWSGRTHWHPEVSTDRLGKPAPEPPFETHGWGGKDRQHWSSNYLGAFAQLTGAHWARRELLHEVQLFLSGETVEPGKSTSGTDAPRGAGRTHLAAAWMYLATGDSDLLARINARLDLVNFAQWAGRELPEGSVRTMAIENPDARMLAGACRYWTPWQDSLACNGFAAAHRITGNQNARTLAETIAVTAVRHGWLVDDKECIVATALRWQDGAPLEAQQERDPAYALWSYGTGFNEWALGAVEIARVAAAARGDTATAQRATEIQRRVRATRQRPADGAIDRMSEWDAVHWEPSR
jgi:hypothetical protein